MSEQIKNATCNERMCKRCKHWRPDTILDYKTGRIIDICQGTCFCHSTRLPYDSYICDQFDSIVTLLTDEIQSDIQEHIIRYKSDLLLYRDICSRAGVPLTDEAKKIINQAGQFWSQHYEIL